MALPAARVSQPIDGTIPGRFDPGDTVLALPTTANKFQFNFLNEFLASPPTRKPARGKGGRVGRSTVVG